MAIAGILIILGIVGVVGGAIVVLVLALSSKKEQASPAPAGEGSYFDGNTLQLIGYYILSALLTTITLGIAYPWVLCMVQRWQVKHTVINGRRLKFNGHGHQLIGKYLLWVFLTIITFGIYGIWLGLGMKKWVVKHTFYADEEQPVESYFSGGAGGFLGIHLLAALLTLFTLGIGKAWADKMVLQWEAKHTHIGGSPLEFNGTGGQLFVKYLLFVLLTPLTLGIYALFFPVIYLKWQMKHTEAVYQTQAIQTKAREHEAPAIQDFAKYRIAANDQEIAAMKSGYTGKEDAAALERLAEENNPFAAYHLAKQTKGEASLYEGKALELLQKSAEGKVHSALLDLAKQTEGEQRIPLLTEAAQYGNAEASLLLANEYINTNNLPMGAYWFKVAMEWGVAEATKRAEEYETLIKKIALQLSEGRAEPKQSVVLPIVLGVAGVGVLAAVIFVLMAVLGITKFGVAKESAPAEVVMYDWNAELEGNGSKENPYIIANTYDLQKYVSYIDKYNNSKLYGTITKDFDIHAEYLFYSSFDDILESFEEQVGDGYLRFQNEDIEVAYEGREVLCKNRINLSDMSQASKPSADNTVAATPVEKPAATPAPQKPSKPAVNTASSIVGNWEYYDMYTHLETGEDTLEIWRFSFRADGTYSFSHEECMVSTEGQTYYGGRAWSTMLGSGTDGKYTLNGDQLKVAFYIEGADAILTNAEYTVNLKNDVLSVYNADWGRTRDFTRAK